VLVVVKLVTKKHSAHRREKRSKRVCTKFALLSIVKHRLEIETMTKKAILIILKYNYTIGRRLDMVVSASGG